MFGLLKKTGTKAEMDMPEYPQIHITNLSIQSVYNVYIINPFLCLQSVNTNLSKQ